MAIAAGSYADIYDVSDGTLSPSTSGATLIVSDAHRIVNLSWSPDGSRLATSHFFKSQLGNLGSTLGAPEEVRAIQVWDIAPGVIQTIPILKIDDFGGGNMSWSPDGARLAMLGCSELLVYDFVSRQVEADLQFDEEYPADVVWSPDGQLLATGGEVIRIWDTNTWEVVGTISAESRVRTLQWSPDGQFLFSDRGSEGLYRDVIPSDILTTQRRSLTERPNDAPSKSEHIDNSMVAQSGSCCAKMVEATRRPTPCLPDQISVKIAQNAVFRRNFGDLREELD